MAKYSDVLLTVDFDRTLTAPDSTVPERNLEAIRHFIAGGGAFTVNTGRSVNSFRPFMEKIPVNAPLLLYNGSAAYEDGRLTMCHPMDLDMWQTMAEMTRRFPDMNIEIQATDTHYLVEPKRAFTAFYDTMGWKYDTAVFGEDIGPFLKFALFGTPHENAVADMYVGTQAELRRFDEVQRQIEQMYSGKVEVFRPAPRIIDVHARGVSKGRAARDLQKRLGRKILVCVGDAENDVAMLDMADFAYCPADGVIADRYETVCPCGDGAVADVIYKKIPEIPGGTLDIRG